MPVQHSRGKLRPIAPRLDELPEGLPAPARTESPSDRGERGRFAQGNSIAVEGAKARAGKTRLARRLRLGDSFKDPRFEPYAKAAVAFRRVQTARLARDVGGGECGPAPSSVVASAALQLAGSRFAFEVLGDIALGSKLANDSRLNLLAAAELCAREARVREDNRTPAEKMQAWEDRVRGMIAANKARAEREAAARAAAASASEG